MKTTRLLFALLAVIFSQCQSERQPVIDLEYMPGEVELFSGNVISTKLHERDIAISSSGDEIIYSVGDYQQTKLCLVRIKKNGNKWENREILSFSGQYNDIEPCFSADGSKLYFASNRPVETNSERHDYNIWVSEKTVAGWSEPEPMPSAINSEHNEFYPSLGKNGNLYFTTSRDNGIGGEDIFLSRFVDGKYLDPVVLDTNINTSRYEFNAYVSPDEDLIIFSSFGRNDDLGGGDLYYSRKDESGNWVKAVNMGPGINSNRLDYCPFVDLPRGNFYFTSEKAMPIDKRLEKVSDIEAFADGIFNGMGNIYRVRSNGLWQ